MEISLAGLLVCAAVWIVGWLTGSPLIFGLIVSIAFGTTSALTLSVIGGSSPLIYFVFAVSLIAASLLKRKFGKDLRATFRHDWVAWAVCILLIYSIGGAVILPRLFAGQTNAFVTSREVGVVEVSLAPNGGNITQTGYFVLGGLTFITILTVLLRYEALSVIRKGFYFWAAINAIGGVIDLTAKMAGAGDVMMPIRTATFAFLTDTEQAGFWRINGTYSEASSFAGAALASMAFTYSLWKHGGSWRALLIAVTLFVLLFLSTSTTGYVGMAVLALPLLGSLARSAARGIVKVDGIVIVTAVVAIAAVLIFVIVYDSAVVEPFQRLFQATLFDKSQSESGRERSYWNQRSLESLGETWGWGIGFGSSRASNWFVAVLSQLGVIGAALQIALVVPFFRRVHRPISPGPDLDAYVLCRSLRACALTSLVAGAIAGGSADPGMLFFIALAGVLACQARLARSDQRALRRVLADDLPCVERPSAAERGFAAASQGVALAPPREDR